MLPMPEREEEKRALDAMNMTDDARMLSCPQDTSAPPERCRRSSRPFDAIIVEDWSRLFREADRTVVLLEESCA